MNFGVRIKPSRKRHLIFLLTVSFGSDLNPVFHRLTLIYIELDLLNRVDMFEKLYSITRTRVFVNTCTTMATALMWTTADTL